MQELVIFGAGGFAKEVSGIIRDINRETGQYNLVGYAVDDEYFIDDTTIHGVKVFNRRWLLEHKEDVKCVCGIGYPKERKAVQSSLISQGVQFVTLIHPTAIIEDGTVIGEGCIIQHNAAVSYDCRVGKGVFLSDYVTLGHDVEIGDFATCFPKSQISGGARIGDNTIIGSLSFINEKIRVGQNAIVAPGSIVFRNVKDNTHVMGNPARKVEL